MILPARSSRIRGRTDPDRRPFLDPWRESDNATQHDRGSDQQWARLKELEAVESRTETEETEFLALSSFTDHADRSRAWDWAMQAAQTRRPLNYVMNTQVNAAKNADSVDSHVDELRDYLPPGTVIIGGAGDSRPAAARRRFGALVNCEVIIIPDAGHEPWREAPQLFAAAFRATVKNQTAT